MLSACTGNADDPDGAAATATPVVAPSAADTSAQSAVSAAVAAATDVTAAGAAARAKAFTGAALVSANASAKMLPGRTAGEKADAELSAQGVKVLAVSRAGDAPAQILAQTTLKKTGAPVLVLLTAKSPAGPYQVAALTPVLPSAKIDSFDPTVDGSPAVGNGKGLAATPDDGRGLLRRLRALPRPGDLEAARRRPAHRAVAASRAPSRRPSTTRARSRRAGRPRTSSAGSASRTARAPSSSPTSSATTRSPCAPRRSSLPTRS